MSSRSKVGSSNSLLLLVSCFASLGVFLFGYDQGVISGILTNSYFKSYFSNPSAYEVGNMVAVLEIGAFVTSLLAGRVGDTLGRKTTLLMGACVFTIGGVIQTFAISYAMMVIGRCVSGFGVGFLSMIVPVYVAEISPAENRGKLACIEFTGNIVGYASSIWIDYFSSFLESDLAWRIPLAVQCIIGLILAVGTIFIPESPRWLMDTDADEQGMKVLADLHGDGDLDDDRAKLEFKEIKKGILVDRVAGDRSYKMMWKKLKYRVLIAASAQAFAQLNGINVISYYAPLVFEEAGWVGRSAIFFAGINGTIYVASTIPTWYLVDRLGRRPILISGALIMSVALSCIAYFLRLDVSYTPVAVVVSVIIFNAGFGYSWGPIPWLYPPEIMPLAFRVKGVSISTATNWLFNWMIGEATPVLQELITWRLYLIHAGFCLCSAVLVYVVYPETMGVPLEEMNRLFNDSPPEDIESSTLLRHSYDETTPPHLRKRAVAGADHSYSKPQKSMFNLFGLFRHASGTDYHTLGREDQ